MTVVELCPFCPRIDSGDVTRQTAAAVAFGDFHPASRGHTLVVPRRHVPSVFGLDADEYHELWELVWAVHDDISNQLAPAGMNVGINVGPAAGQTVVHAHVHVIPRYSGDVPDPRGGVRWVLPERAAYWIRERDAVGSRRRISSGEHGDHLTPRRGPELP
jgi:diadenosine tetraphosphate (Ap4A) HIT family hydrolase